MIKHTPGPYYVEGKWIKTACPDRKGDVIAESYLYHFQDEYPGEYQANARLIAAAPDLLAQLTSLEDVLGTLLEAGRIDWCREDAPEIHGRLEEARAAIAKASGHE